MNPDHSTLVDRPPSAGSVGSPLDISRTTLAPVLRPDAALGVLDITKFFGPTTGGIRTYLLEKSDYIESREDLRHTVLIPGAADAIADQGGTRWYRLRGPRIPTQYPYRFMLATRSIRRVIEHERPHIIEVGSPYLLPWITRRSARRIEVPLVWFYHTDFPRIISPRPAVGPLHRRLAGSLARRYVARLRGAFHAAIGASDTAVDALTSAGFDRVDKVPLGVDLNHFHPRRRQEAAETRRLAGLPEGPLAMFVGRLAREKELHLVIDAWPAVEARTGAHLAIVGDGPSRQFFQERCRARRVTWLSYQTDRDRLANLIAAADLVVAPGPAETFGLAALEALASGVPILSSDVGAVRELVEASAAGVVNPAPRADAMAESILKLFAADLPSLGARGRRYAETYHGWGTVFDRLFGIYRKHIADFHAR